jgi:hypothetical protein
MRQFSIRTLMAVIIVSALGLVALRNAQYWWAGLLPLMAAVALEIAVLSAMFLRGLHRAWWASVALSVAGYLVLTLDPWLSPNLATTYILENAHAKLAPADLEHDSSYYDIRGLPLPVDSRWQPLFGEAVALEPFLRLGHCLFALLIGLVGGTVVLWFYMRHDARWPALATVVTEEL